MTQELTRLVSSGVVAKLLGVDPKTVSRYARIGKLPATRTLGGHFRFDLAEVKRVWDAEQARGRR